MSRYMNTMRMSGITLAAVLLALSFASVSMGAPAKSESLLKMRAGVCNFKLLDSNGVKPIPNATLSLTSAKDASSVSKAISDSAGTCSIKIAAGRYILSVNRQHLAVLDASDNVKISECRIVVPEAGMLVGGAGEEVVAEEEAGGLLAWLTGGGSGMQPVIIGGTVILTGVGGYYVYDAATDDDDDPPLVVDPPTVVARPTPVSD